MDLQEIIFKKKELQMRIHKAISDFKKETGINSVSVSTTETRYMDRTDMNLLEVNVEIKL